MSESTIERVVVIHSFSDLKECCLEVAALGSFAVAGSYGVCPNCMNSLKTVLEEYTEDDDVFLRGAPVDPSLVLDKQTRRMQGGTRVQTIMLSKKRFSRSEAIAWAKAHGFHSGKVDETSSFYRFRQMEPGEFRPGTFRTIQMTNGVMAVVGVPKRVAKDVETEEEKARGEGQGVGGPRQGDGGASKCVCPKCGTEIAHERGVPCSQSKCPKCGADLVGKSVENDVEKSEDGRIPRFAVKGALDIMDGHSHQLWLFVEDGRFQGVSQEVQGHRHTCSGEVDVHGQIQKLEVSRTANPSSGETHEHGYSTILTHAFIPSPGREDETTEEVDNRSA